MKRQPIALLNPPSLPGNTANREGAAGMGAVRDAAGGFVYPPQTLATTAAALREAGHRDVVAVDAVGEALGLAATMDRVAAHAPGLVGVFVSPATRAADRACLRALHECLPGTPFVTFGPGSRFMAHDPEIAGLAHAVLIGEPELAFAALVAALGTDSDPRGAVSPAELGVAGYDSAGRLLDLNVLPHPAWDLLPRYAFYTLQAGRGCPDSCVYCPYVVAQGTTHRPRDPLRVADEMAWLAATFSPPRLIFRDPVFAHDRERVMALCRILQERRFDVPWECESRPEQFYGELLRVMKRAGCRVIKIGLETVDARLLVQWQRVPSLAAASAYVRHTAQVIRAAQQLAITVRLFVMVGLPDQTEQSVRETARFVHTTQPNALHVMPFVPHPGLTLTGPRPAPDEVTAQRAILEEAARGLGDRPPARRRWMFWRR